MCSQPKGRLYTLRLGGRHSDRLVPSYPVVMTVHFAKNEPIYRRESSKPLPTHDRS